MTIEHGSFQGDTEDIILDALIRAAEDAFGESLDADEASMIRAFYQPVASYLASQQDDISNVLQATQIDHAEGRALDLRCALIGVPRNEAEPATARQQFIRDSRTQSTYTVPQGTRVQTDEADPIYFETDEVVELKFLDGFESNNLDDYTGDTGVFSTQGTTVYDGSYALEASANTGTIIWPDNDVVPPATLHFRQYLESGAVAGTLFGVEDASNYYSVVLDEGTGSLSLEKTEAGSTSTVDSAVSATLPAGEWLDVKVEWAFDGEVTVTVTDAAGSEVASETFVDGVDPHGVGGIGYESQDSSASKYWDNYTMSAVGAPITATASGGETNVGADTLTVASSSIAGIDSVTNPVAGSGGRDQEEDDDYRERAKRELSEGMRASLPALISQIGGVDAVKSVTVIDNDENTTDGDGRPGHSFEAIVEAPQTAYDDVAERIVTVKAAGDTSVGGYAGSSVTRTVELSNGQSKNITFSEPVEAQLYIDLDLEKTDTYAGDDDVRDNIVQYTGGSLSSGDTVSGELDAGDDIVYNQVVEAVMDVEGVYDITNLEIGTSASPTGTSNISIANSETATADATDSSLDVSSSDA